MLVTHYWTINCSDSVLRADRMAPVDARRLSCFFFSSRRRHTRFDCDWSSDVCSSDLSLSPCSTLTRLPPCCASTPRLHRSGRERARFPPSTTVTAGCFAPQNWIPGSNPKYTYPAMRAANRRKFDEASTLSVWLFATET